jgi:hypothetical protein
MTVMEAQRKTQPAAKSAHRKPLTELDQQLHPRAVELAKIGTIGGHPLPT